MIRSVLALTVLLSGGCMLTPTVVDAPPIRPRTTTTTTTTTLPDVVCLALDCPEVP